MFDQLAVFTPKGEVLYGFSPLGRKFAEQQVNGFISHLLNNFVAKKDDAYGNFSVLNVTNTKSSRGFTAMFHVSKQPELYYVVTYGEQSLELNTAAESALKLVISLWLSLDLNELLFKRAEVGFEEMQPEIQQELSKLDRYFTAKFESSSTKTTSKQSDSQVEHNQKAIKVKKLKGKGQDKIKTNGGGRKWGRDGTMEDTHGTDSSTLDFSDMSKENTAALDNATGATQSFESNIDEKSFGKRTEQGDFLIKEIDDLLSSKKKEASKNADSKKTMVKSTFGFLQKHILGNKTITEADLKSVLEKMKQKLISKNVAPEAADFLIEQVSRDLIGSKTDNWTSVENTARTSLNNSLKQILTPGVSINLLHDIQQKRAKVDANGKKQPYVFSVVGVNGVGKSTNLSKLAFWLLQNDLKVLIVACDTFRSGAVEQLRVHVENLAQLTDESHVRGSKNRRNKTGNDTVELFEAGYGGSDLVTKVAKQAIKYAVDYDFDIVLMDTAGRRHNDPTLMSPLKSFAEQANPDKIIMVGEALVGTDSVQQAKNFNNAFGKVRDLDYFLVSKCDTVGDMLGTMVNMVYATGIPILFVGVGQTYTDLRSLSVEWAVNTLMT